MDESSFAELRAMLSAQSAQIAALTAVIAPTVPATTLAEACARDQHGETAGYMLAPIVSALGARAAASLSVSDWEAYRSSRADLAPSSRNLALRTLKAVLRRAARAGGWAADPPLCKAPREKARKGRDTAPTEQDVLALLAESTPRERVIVLCAADAGMRRNEIRQMQWPWLAGDGETIAIPDWAAKGGRGGIVPSTYRLYSAIRALPRDLRSPYVIVNDLTGQPLCRSRFSILFSELQARAGLISAPLDRRVVLHDLRHGFATNAVARGVRIEVVSEILRHASLEQTRAYVQRRPGDLAAARVAFQAGIEREARA